MLQNRQVPWLEAQELDDLYLDLNNGTAREEVVLQEAPEIIKEAKEELLSMQMEHEDEDESFSAPMSMSGMRLWRQAAPQSSASGVRPQATSVASSISDGMSRIRRRIFGAANEQTESRRSSYGQSQALKGSFIPCAGAVPVAMRPTVLVSAAVASSSALDVDSEEIEDSLMQRRIESERDACDRASESDHEKEERMIDEDDESKDDLYFDDFESDGRESCRDQSLQIEASTPERASSSQRKEVKAQADRKKAKKSDKRTTEAPPRQAPPAPPPPVEHSRRFSLFSKRTSQAPRGSTEGKRPKGRMTANLVQEEEEDACDKVEKPEKFSDRTLQVEHIQSISITSEWRVLPLRCHVLFSSPLCVERPVALTVPVASLPEGNLEAFFKSQYAIWGLSFEAFEPARLSAVFGMARGQNLLQTHAEAMLRPGDEVFKVMVFAGSVETTTKPAQATSATSTSVTSTASTSSPSRSAKPPLVPSAGGIQGFVQSQPLAPVLARLLANQPRNSGPLNIQLIFRGMRPLPQLDVEEEVAEVRRSGCVAVPGALTSENFRRLIAARDCEVLHLALHCSSGQAQHLYLEDMQGKAHVMSSKDFEGLLRAGQDLQCIKLVVLNACHSLTVGQCFVAAGVQHVVCVRDDREVRDESCRSFTRNFFSALRSGRNVQEAFDCGVASLQHAASAIQQADASAFLLLPEGDHSTELEFNAVESSRTASAPSMPSRLPAVVEDFMGREVDLWKTMCLLKSRRLISLNGVKGIGKSALLAALGHFIDLRRTGSCAFDQVYWLGGKTNAADFQQLLEILRESPDLNVLVIVNMSSEAWEGMPVEELLNLSRKVRLVVESNRWTAGSDVKSTPYSLGPLEPLSQARLFLQRAARPLYDFELEPTHQPGQMPSSEPSLANISLQPSTLMAIAELPWIKALQGVPLRIVEAAKGLETWEATRVRANEPVT
eukprot:symbB.v1.2.027184.t1/scaffold2771.1/size70997/6